MPVKAHKQKPARSKGSSQTGRKITTESTPPPQWPPLEPLVPSMDLSLEVLSDNQIMIIRNFFTSTLCQKYVSFLANQPLMTTPSTPKAGDAVRVNDRIQFDDYSFSQHLWQATGLAELMKNFEISSQGIPAEQQSKYDWGGDLCGLNPRIRVYRYSKGQFFGQHCKSGLLPLISWGRCHQE